MSRKTSRRHLLAASLALGFGMPSILRGGQLRQIDHTEPCMGTLFTIRAYHHDEEAGYRAIAASFARMHALDQILSDYRPGNELDLLCQRAHIEPIRVSDDLYRVLQFALNVSRQTDGAFDVTLGPVVRMWRTARKAQRLPSLEERHAARALTGWQDLAMNVRRRTVHFAKAGMQIDFGGIAKGYAADAAREVLRKYGILRSSVAAGGDVGALHPPPGETSWRVALEDGQNETATVLLRQSSVSTSGDLNQFVELDGVRYSHIVDPSTGIGLTSRRVVSVVAPTGMQCDALSTAFSVMELPRVKAFLKKNPAATTRVVSLAKASPVVWQSQGFPLARD